eukprot:s9123_g2.t1
MEKDGGPDIVRRGVRVSVVDLSTDPELSGWRPLDARRLEELKASVLVMKLNQSIMRDPQCVVDSEGKVLTDHKGLALIGDGMHFVKVLQLLHAELQEGSREESSLSGRLLDCLQNGIYVDHVVFPEQDRLHRIIWYTHCHDEEENKFKSSSLFDKMSLIHTMKAQAAGGSLDEVNAKLIKVLGPNKFKSSSLFDKMSLIHTMKAQAAGGSLDEVNAKLIKVLGPGSRSKVQKWTRLYRGLHDPIRDALLRYERVPHGYLFDNAYFRGHGAQSSWRLNADDGLLALDMVLADSRLQIPC